MTFRATPENDVRTREMIALREQGLSFQKIADQFDLEATGVQRRIQRYRKRNAQKNETNTEGGFVGRSL